MGQVPSAEVYEGALAGMVRSRALTDTYRKLLRAHFAGPNHTLTTRQLAHAMAWDTHSPVNAHYGIFGEKLATRMRWLVPTGEPKAFTLATFEGGDPDDPETKWIMRPELASALVSLKIVPRRGHGDGVARG